MIREEDDHALSFGRYFRAARFQVINPKLTIASYEREFKLILERFAFLDERETEALKEALYTFIEFTMCIPASSTIHHRTAGGLFFHSLETAALAAAYLQEEDHCTDEGMILAGFIGGLMHDAGKILTLFHVYPLRWEDQSRGFGTLEIPDPDLPRWDPMQESLWSWSQEHNVKYLMLHYQRDSYLGHEAATGTIWRKLISEDLLDAIRRRNPDALQAMEEYLDRREFHHTLVSSIKKADVESIERDLDPKFRWQPKYSDLHVSRRFIEYASICSWNTAYSPFIMADIWIDGSSTGEALPFFRMSYEHLHSFGRYLRSEENFGASLRDNGRPAGTVPALEMHGILNKHIPFIKSDMFQDVRPWYWPAVNATIQFVNGEDCREIEEPVSYFPLGSKIAWAGMPEVRVLF